MQISWALNFLQQQMARLWIIVNALLASDPYNVSYRPGRRLTDSQILTKETFNHFWLTLPGEAIRSGLRMAVYLLSKAGRVNEVMMSRLGLSLGPLAHRPSS